MAPAIGSQRGKSWAGVPQEDVVERGVLGLIEVTEQEPFILQLGSWLANLPGSGGFGRGSGEQRL